MHLTLDTELCLEGAFDTRLVSLSAILTTSPRHTKHQSSTPSLSLINLDSHIRNILSITENGFPVKNENSLTPPAVLEDTDRVEYYNGATTALMEAIHEDGCDIRAYFGWSESQLAVLSCFSPALEFPRILSI